MALHSRLHVFNTMVETGLIPVFYNPDPETARRIVEACFAGGTRVIEFTNRGDFAVNVFREVRQHCIQTYPDLVFGVGSVVDAPTAALYIANGADFVVGPILNPEVARLCNRRKIAYSPGCATLSEISEAEELGVEIVKIFPGATVGGPSLVKAVRGPCPWTRIMPTGGVEPTEESIRSWFEAGVVCVGMGSKLITKQDVADGNFAAITDRCQRVLSWIKQYRNAG